MSVLLLFHEDNGIGIHPQLISASLDRCDYAKQPSHTGIDFKVFYLLYRCANLMFVSTQYSFTPDCAFIRADQHQRLGQIKAGIGDLKSGPVKHNGRAIGAQQYVSRMKIKMNWGGLVTG